MIIQYLSDSSDFHTEILASNVPVLVIFSAIWCGPCQSLKEVLNNSLKKIDLEKFKIISIDIDQYPDLTNEYSIRTIPTCLIFFNKEIKSTFSGKIDVFKLLDTLKILTV